MDNLPPDWDNIVIEDSEGYRGNNKSGLSFRQIVLMQFNKCCQEGSKEMSGGGYQERVIDGESLIIAVQNQREIYINNIKQLRMLLLPKLTSNKIANIKKLVEEFNKNKKELDASYQTVPSTLFPRNSPDFKKNPQGYTQVENQHKKNVKDKYELKMVHIYEEYLFRALSFLLADMNYFDERDG